MDNTGKSAGGPDWSRITNLNVCANSAGYPITAHPLKHAISFGRGTISAHLDRFTFIFTGVHGEGIIDISEAFSVNISRGEIETGWISDSTDVYGIKITKSADISLRELYFEQNNHGILLNGSAGNDNYNISMDNIFINGSYAPDGEHNWSKDGIRIDSAYNHKTSITNCRIVNVTGTGTDIVIAGLPDVTIFNTETDDNVPNNGDVIAIIPTTVLASGTATSQTDISLTTTIPFRAKTISGWVELTTAGTAYAIYPQGNTSANGQLTFTLPAGVASQKIPFNLQLNGLSRIISYYTIGGASITIVISGYSF